MTNPDPPAFDDFAEDYDAVLQKGLDLSGERKEYFAAGRIRWLARRLKRLGASPRAVLDFGCGTGSATPWFFEFLAPEELAGFDPSERSIEVASRTWTRHPARFHSSASSLVPASFDLAFCNGVFHHIPPSDRPAAVRTVHQALRPGGLFAFYENNPWNPLTRLSMKRVSFDRDAIMLWPPEARSLLTNAGFQVLATDYLFFFPRALAAFRPLEPWLRGFFLGAQYLVLARKS